jgi:pimeloyl-ACP methyl ester carboxylesterase
MSTLLALHGYTLNGAAMRVTLEPLASRLPAHLQLICPDGPVKCSPSSVERMYGLTGGDRLPEPHLSWWDASDDGRVYHGWEQTREKLRAELDREGPVGVLGFSQGAMLAAALAALAARGELPAIHYAILIAGRAPRAELMQPWFEQPIAVPSLHVWGERDRFTAGASALVEHFDPSSAQTVVWPGPHMIPTSGNAADAIVAFVAEHG